jgi:hypothetical protein
MVSRVAVVFNSDIVSNVAMAGQRQRDGSRKPSQTLYMLQRKS